MMRHLLRLAAGAATVSALGALAAPVAFAGSCTPVDNRIRVSGRSSNAIVATAATDVPKVIPDGGTGVSTITLADSGAVRLVRVMDIHLSHGDLSQVTLHLRAPDGTLLLLANSLAGSNLVATAFADAAPSIFVGLPPYTGTFAPQAWLASLYGQALAGDWKLEVSDQAGGGSGTLTAWTLELTPQSCGSQPTAAFSATPNPVNPGGTVDFDANASAGGGGSPVTIYEWDLDGDGSFETNTGATATVSNTYPTKGTYAIGLRVTDGSGATDQTVRALAVTSPPVASFTITPTSPLSLVNVSLDASASYDPDGTIVRYEWDLDGDGDYEVDATNITTIQRLFATSGARDVSLRVTDDSGATNIATVNVVVQNRPPIADFALQSTPAIVGAPTVLDASSSVDLDGTITNYEWDFDNNGTYEANSGGSPTVSHVFSASGSYTIGLRVTDNGGYVHARTRTVTATQAPVAVFGAAPLVVRPGTAVTFDPTGSMDPDPLGSVVSYAWDFDGDGTTDLTTTSPDPVTHTYSAFANYTARLTVTDDLGATGTSTVVVQVVNAAPVAALSISPATALTGQTVTLSAAGSLDPDGTIVKYEWDLDGNGTYETSTGTTSSVSRSFPNRMRVTARVRVTDNDGATAIAGGALSVDPALVTPPPTPTGPTATGPGGSTPGSGPGSGPGAGAATATPTGAFTATLAGTSIQKLKTVLRRGVKIRCSVDRKATCTVLLVMKARDVKRWRLAKGKRARRSMTVARATMKTTAAGTRTLKLKFKSTARKRLRRARRIVLLVKGTAKDGAGATARLQRAVLLR